MTKGASLRSMLKEAMSERTAVFMTVLSRCKDHGRNSVPAFCDRALGLSDCAPRLVSSPGQKPSNLLGIGGN